MDDHNIINLLKGLVIDGVHYARSGHPGGAMSSMDFAYLLFRDYLKFDPDNPKWLGRDRFILSAGHESMLLYALLYARGWLERDDLRSFRQLGSRTPGHPENTVTPGVECTTGPLGQGCGMSVGFAIAARHLAARLNPDLFSYNTWVLLGDGCLQEGITLASASYAGHLGLGNLIWYYDKNRTQISGKINRSTSDDETHIFKGFGWEVLKVNGHDHRELREAIQKALKITDKPCLIVGESVMAKGAVTMEGMHGTHGAPLPEKERTETKRSFGIPDGEDFWFPETAQDFFCARHDSLRDEVRKWDQNLAACRQDTAFDTLYLNLFESTKISFPSVKWNESASIATRQAFGQILEAWAADIPSLIGGSADLEPSNMTEGFASIVGDFQKDSPGGRNLCFGVREFPMSAITNGIALHGGLLPFDATFLAFSDYSRPALRLGSIQKCRVIHEFSHDSFYLGEDGPTHQPVEQLMSLRAIPDHYVMRPADPGETELMMQVAASVQAPSSICLSRQKTEYLPVQADRIRDAVRGGWIVRGAADQPCDLIIFATGSEVSLALKTATLLEEKKHCTFVRVISLPCWELFAEQDQAWQDAIMTRACHRRVSIEAGSSAGWERFIGMDGLAIGLNHFGASAPAHELEKKYGFTPEQVCGKIVERWFQK
ncbi:MAG: transketolase [Deltaproteobacteria bacterium]|nr:transketolase [Deltaproteobacteria bacterium]